MINLDKINESLMVLAAGTIVTALGYGTFFINGFGLRGTHDEYITKFQGRSAVVKREDVRGGFDKYYILINGGESRIDSGRIITDDRKIIDISDGTYSVRDGDYKLTQK